MGREDSRGLAGDDGWEGLTLNIAKGIASAYSDTCVGQPDHGGE